MSFDYNILGKKLKKFKEQLELTSKEISTYTGIDLNRILLIEEGKVEPSGDEILIFSDFYKCDYNYFISNEKLAPYEQVSILYRIHGGEITKEDRWAIQEFLFLCESEHYLQELLQKNIDSKIIDNFKNVTDGNIAAQKVREGLGLLSKQITPVDLFSLFRKIGIHVFRRRLRNSKISGLFIKHPYAGRCVLINYDDDVYRQRFTICHEVAHSILDINEGYNISYSSDDRKDPREVRANKFASEFLIPEKFILENGLDKITWDASNVIRFAKKLHVNIQPLIYSLQRMHIISRPMTNQFEALKITRAEKTDPELSIDLTPKIRDAKELLLKRGLTSAYVNLCYDAYKKGLISAARMSEMLLSEIDKLEEILMPFNLKVN